MIHFRLYMTSINGYLNNSVLIIPGILIPWNMCNPGLIVNIIPWFHLSIQDGAKNKNKIEKCH